MYVTYIYITAAEYSTSMYYVSDDIPTTLTPKLEIVSLNMFFPEKTLENLYELSLPA